VRERLPIRQDVFLVHGEQAAMSALAARLDGVVDPARIVMPELDAGFALTPTGAAPLAAAAPPRLPPEKVARMDWHNDVSRLMLDINDALRASPDEKTRAVVIRRLRRALEQAEDAQP
jgi:metallo-beta-lactamase family protein